MEGKNKFKITFDKTSHKLATNFLLDQCFSSIRNSFFRQIICIPVGSDPAPFMGNLFLYYYEIKWPLSKKKINLVNPFFIYPEELI